MIWVNRVVAVNDNGRRAHSIIGGLPGVHVCGVGYISVPANFGRVGRAMGECVLRGGRMLKTENHLLESVQLSFELSTASVIQIEHL